MDAQNERRSSTSIATVAALQALPGVSAAEQQGPRMVLHCSDSDVALRAMLSAFPDCHDIEIRTGNLEDAFLELTANATGAAA
jgi:ABC-2 type transport system ATP-binding protein